MSLKRPLSCSRPNAKRSEHLNLDNLFMNGIPTTKFERDSASSTNHYSDHTEVRNSHIKSFGTLENLTDILEEVDALSIISMLLSKLQKKKDTYRYSNEIGIQYLVQLLFDDILTALGYDEVLEVRAEVSLTKIKYLGKGGSNKSDFWIILTTSGRPIMIVEVKSPSTPKVLENAKVHGQAFDYMCDVMSFFGQYHVFGVTTTMENFCIHWFPHSDEYAASTVIPSLHEMPSLDLGNVVDARVLHHSRLIPHDDPQLLPMLASAVVKCAHSPHAPVGVIDLKRAYVQVTANGWHWTRINPNIVTGLSLELTALAAASTGFLIVKYFFRTEEKKVWLVISQQHMQLFVAKVVNDEPAAEQEVDVWRRVNGCPNAFVTKLRDAPAVGMPFAIHASTDRETCRVSFDLDISHWTLQNGAEAQTLPSQLAAFQEQVQRLGAGLDARTVAARAIERTAAQGVEHDDLAWRHIALLPVFAAGDVVELRPVLIDFGKVTLDVEPTVAEQVMKEKLRLMTEECVWESELI